MRFLIARTSLHYEQEQPCPEAIKLEQPLDTGWKFDFYWQIEFATLDALMEFCKSYGEIVMFPPRGKSEYWIIEIYDGYRE